MIIAPLVYNPKQQHTANTVPNVFDNEDHYRSIVLGGVESPGQVVLTGHDRKINWDVQIQPWTQGATVRLKSRPPIEFTATFYLTYDIAQNLNDFEAWPAFAKLAYSTTIPTTDSNGNRKFAALPIYHPDLAPNNIKQVVAASIGGLNYDGKGGAHVAIKFQEYFPLRLLVGSASATPKIDPNADVKATLKSFTTQYQNTPWG